MLRPTDRLRVIAFAQDVREVVPIQHISSWTPAGLLGDTRLKTIETLLRFGHPEEGGLDLDHDPVFRTWPVFDALLLAVARPPELGRRHVIIGFSVGQDIGSILKDAGLFAAVAARTDAVLHVALWNRRLMNGVVESTLGAYTRAGLTAAAVETGGEMHDAGDALSAFKSIFAAFRQSYVLQYTLKGVPSRGWHAVNVTLPGFPAYKVRARTGYMGR